MAESSFNCPQCNSVQYYDEVLKEPQIICSNCLNMIDVPGKKTENADNPKQLPTENNDCSDSGNLCNYLMKFYRSFYSHWTCHAALTMLLASALCLVIVLSPVLSGSATWAELKMDLTLTSLFAAAGLALLLYGIIRVVLARKKMAKTIEFFEKKHQLSHQQTLELMLENLKKIIPATEYCLGLSLNQRFSTLEELEKFFVGSEVIVFHRYNCLEKAKKVFLKQAGKRKKPFEKFLIAQWGEAGRSALHNKIDAITADIDRCNSRIIFDRLRQCGNKQSLPELCPECDHDQFDFQVEYKQHNHGVAQQCSLERFPFRTLPFSDRADGKYRKVDSSMGNARNNCQFSINDYIIECRKCGRSW